nr:uncharacterized protein LOC125421859 [Ziziphus jujuba var. spinosa]
MRILIGTETVSEEKHDLDSLNKDLERRAATAEAALKRARLNYSIAVDQLQKDLELLSSQVLSMYETNENLIKQAFSESSLPSFPEYEEMAQNQKLDSKESHAARLLQSLSQEKEALIMTIKDKTEESAKLSLELNAEISWLQQLLMELNFSLPTIPILWCDNMGAGCLAANPVFHNRTKHIEVDVHFVHDKVLQRTLEVRYVPTVAQTADIFTKVLSTARFKHLRDKLNVVFPPFRLRGDDSVKA